MSAHINAMRAAVRLMSQKDANRWTNAGRSFDYTECSVPAEIFAKRNCLLKRGGCRLHRRRRKRRAGGVLEDGALLIRAERATSGGWDGHRMRLGVVPVHGVGCGAIARAC